MGSDAVSGLFAGDSGGLTDTLGGALEGKSPEEIANLISTRSAAGGVIPRNSTEDNSGLVSSMVGERGILEGKSPEEIAGLVSSGALTEMPQETIDALIQDSATADAAP
ncbi:MAG TPA: hypothetical protein EYM52_07070 [Dehalococcoidia bacterium]|nr:hypothetical protein [Dehalococcoidia bacterium]